MRQQHKQTHLQLFQYFHLIEFFADRIVGVRGLEILIIDSLFYLCLIVVI